METKKVLIGQYAPDFELLGVDGDVHHLHHYLERVEAVVVVFMCNHCPYVRAYLDRLKQLQTDYHPRVTLIGINANDDQIVPEDGFEPMKQFAEAQALNFPYVRDSTQDVARGFGASSTPEIYLIDSNGIVRYNGRIDDHAQDPSQVRSHDLRNALDQLLDTGQVTTPSTQAVGCSLKWRS